MSEQTQQEQAEGTAQEVAREEAKPQPAEAKREPTVVSYKDFQRLTGKLQSERDKERQKVADLARKLDEATSELEIARQYGGDEDAAQHARDVAREKAALKAAREDLAQREAQFAALQRQAAVSFMHNQHGIPLELLDGAENADQIEAITYRWLFEQKGKSHASESAAQEKQPPPPRRQDTGEGLRAKKGVMQKSMEEFAADWDADVKAAIKRAAGGS